MTLSTVAHRHWRLALMVPLLALAGCAGGEEVTGTSLASARQRWKDAGVRDYELEWTNSGPGHPRYRVTVRDGSVKKVLIVLPDGSTRETQTHEPRYFGVEGLFLTIAEDLAQLRTDAPFGLPKGSSAVLRFTPDPTYGYPRSYRRDVSGLPRAVAFDVLRFDPAPPRTPTGRTP